MLTQTEYALRIMELSGKVSILDTLIAFRECRAPLKPRCLFGPSDKKENLNFARAALLSDRKQFFKRYSVMPVEKGQKDLLFELCSSVKRKLKAEDSARSLKIRRIETDRQNRLENPTETCLEDVRHPNTTCLVDSEKNSISLPAPRPSSPDDSAYVKQTHITDFWQIKRKRADLSIQKSQAPTSSISHAVDHLKV